MTFTEDEEKIIEAMARAACEADGRDPEAWIETGSFTTNDEAIKILLWSVYIPKAKSHYAMQKAMDNARSREVYAPTLDESYEIMAAEDRAESEYHSKQNHRNSHDRS